MIPTSESTERNRRGRKIVGRTLSMMDSSLIPCDKLGGSRGGKALDLHDEPKQSEAGGGPACQRAHGVSEQDYECDAMKDGRKSVAVSGTLAERPRTYLHAVLSRQKRMQTKILATGPNALMPIPGVRI